MPKIHTRATRPRGARNEGKYAPTSSALESLSPRADEGWAVKRVKRCDAVDRPPYNLHISVLLLATVGVPPKGTKNCLKHEAKLHPWQKY